MFASASLANPDLEVRSSRVVQCHAMYPSTILDLWIWILHWCACKFQLLFFQLPCKALCACIMC